MQDKRAARVVIPLPNRDFDPTEAAVSWQILKEAGHQVLFATPDGSRAYADPRMLTGEELDLWSFIHPLKKIRLLGLMLRANDGARQAYLMMESDPAFLKPMTYRDLSADRFDGLLLPGGHYARGMRRYLEDSLLQAFIGEFFSSKKPVGAICHGVVAAARSVSPGTGRSVLYGRKTTALTWKLEKSAWSLMRFMGRVWDPGYYRTYPESRGEPEGYRSVQAEVTRSLARPEDFLDVPRSAPDYFRKTSGMFRDTLSDHRPSWVVQDGSYVSARWPGDVHKFALTLSALLSAG
ncbi:MAG TPA: type 1 glutamine amidotransferase domain-containing protein [Desulfomonilia bacterium]|nr:type 1 glutamine amidotransferase domain-containing protein [Desulfomonilia bacterium]